MCVLLTYLDSALDTVLVKHLLHVDDVKLLYIRLHITREPRTVGLHLNSDLNRKK